MVPQPPLLHGQPRLGALQGLDLALFIHAQDDGLVGGIEVEPDDVGELFGEARVRGELVAFCPVGLQAVGEPDALHGVFAQALRLGHGAGTPVGRPSGLAPRGCCHDLGDPLGGEGRTPAPARSDVGEGVHAALLETAAPEEHRGAPHPELPSNAMVARAICGSKDDLGPQGDALRSVFRLDPGFQRASLFVGHDHGSGCVSHAASIHR